MKTDIKKIKDIRVWYNDVILVTKDFRGKPESKKILDLSYEELYDLFMDVYKLGKQDKLSEIKKALKL